MGAALLAHDEQLDRYVVLKQLKIPPMLREEPRRLLIARMEWEARLAGRLKHPNIITTHDQIRDEHGLPWIVME